MTIDDRTLTGLLKDAFDADNPEATLSQMHDGLRTLQEGRKLLVGTDDRTDTFYAIPFDLDRLRAGIEAIRPSNPAPDAPVGEPGESLRPDRTSPYAWERLDPKERAATAMHAQTEEWDFRGALSDMKPAGVAKEDLAIMARVLLTLSAHEFAKLARIGRQAAGETR